jgi:YVTN family beta-propeller protein
VSSAAERPTGTVTFLFTDIEGSTRLLKQLRDDYGTALADHQKIVRDALAAQDGWEIDTQGDSFFAAFRRAKDAVAAAVEIQRALTEHEWPQGTELRVRMGIHTGEPAVGGERYVGLGVHRAARIAAAGHGGQVLVSATTRELLRDDPPPDVSLRDLGEHQLKDMDEPERIYQLVAPGLGEDFPLLKTTAPALAADREGELVEAAQDTVAEMTSPWRQRRYLVGAGVAVAVVLAVVLGLVLTRSSASASGTVAANSVGVVDTGSGKVHAEIGVGHAPSAIAAGGDAIWVTNTNDSSVSRIDATTNDVNQTIDVGSNPSGIAVGGGSVWVANGFDGTVSRISSDTNRVVQTIPVGNGPTAVTYGDGAVWVANGVDGTISRIDPASGNVTRTFPAATGISGLAYGSKLLWVSVLPSGTVLAFDPTAGEAVHRIGVGVDPSAVAYGAGAVWVTNRSDGTVTRIDPRAANVTDAIPVGQSPVAVTAGNDGVWVASAASGTISKLDPSQVRVVKTIHVGNQPGGLTTAPDGVYVAVRSTGLSHRGGKLRVAAWFPYDYLDPAVAYSLTSWQLFALTNDGLVGFRRVGGVQGLELVPDLAAALPVAGSGGKTLTFRLRPDIRYSNGRVVQPQDFRRALERVLSFKNPPSGGASYYRGIVGAAKCKPGRRCDLSRGVIADPVARTVTFRLTKPDPDFLTKLAMPCAYAVPASTPDADQSKHPLPATGPYEFAPSTKNVIRLVRNPRFREWSADAQPAGYPDEIIWHQYPDATAVAGAVAGGRADIGDRLSPGMTKQQLADVATRYPSALRTETQLQTLYYFLNTRIPPFNDRRARLAVNYAFDRSAYAQTLGLGATVTCQLLPPNFPSYRRTCPFVPNGVAGLDKARRLVRASGTSGQTVRVWVPDLRVPPGRFMVSVLRSLGYRARLKVIPGGPDKYFPLIADTRTHAQIGFSGWTPDYPSETGFLTVQFACSAFVPGHPELTSDSSFFCDRRIDRLMARAAAVEAVNPAASHTLWQQAEKELLAQGVVVPTENPASVDMVAKRVGNYQFHPQWHALMDQLWVR